MSTRLVGKTKGGLFQAVSLHAKPLDFFAQRKEFVVFGCHLTVAATAPDGLSFGWRFQQLSMWALSPRLRAASVTP
jgi:hypothetical protein